EMDEGRAGGRVEADSAALQAEPDFANPGKRHIGKIKIERLAQHMLAELRDAAASRAEHRVRRRRAITADDLDRGLAAGFALGFPDEVDQMRIHLDRFLAPPVAELPVDLLQRGLVVAAVHLVGDGEVFAGVDVMEGNRAGVAVCDHTLQAFASEKEDEGREAYAFAVA